MSEIPEGALSVADNIVIDKDSIAEPRRGFGYLTHGSGTQSTFSDPSYRANKIFYYQNQILCHYDTNLFAYHDSTSGWTNYSGTFNPPSTTVPVRSAQANQNFYFTTSKGVYKLDSYTGTPGAIGVPQALDTQLTIAVSVTPTATTVNTSTVLTSVSSITGVAIGMSVSGTNIPAGTYITDFDATTITISQAATGSGSSITMTIGIPSTWLATGAASGLNTTGYRVMWIKTDANKNLIQGAPSGFVQISNTTGSSVAPIVSFTIPAGITTSHYYQIYRAAAVANGVTPNDEEGLVYQGSPTAGDLAYGTISILDIVPDALRGATIYTASSQQGLVNENVAPPFAYDITVFRNSMFYGNTSGLQSFNLTLLGTGSPAGIQSGDTVTLGGVVFTADTTESISTGHFNVSPVVLVTPTGTTHTSTTIDSISSMTGIAVGQLVSGAGIPSGTFVVSVNGGGSSVVISQATTASAGGVTLTFTGDSAAQAIRDTALSLIRVINRYASSTLYAYYLSGVADLPGMILIQSRTVGASTFYALSSRSTCWSPSLPTSGTTQASTSSTNKNYIFYSKAQQPEHVPPGNYIPVGSADKNILRIIALRDSLFILKEDGVFYLTGTDSSNFQVWPLDYTTNLVSAESAVALNNQIYCFTTQGVVSITQNGVAIMSRAIEKDLTSLIVENYTVLQTTSFGIAYESSRAYYLFCISNANDTGPSQYYRYNYITNTWTHSLLSKKCGAVNPVDDKLYLGNATTNITDVENKNLTYSDYADYQSTQTISAVNGTQVTISSSDTIAVGSIIFQSATVFGTVSAVNTLTGICTTTLATDLVAGAADIFAPISCNIQWVPLTFANAGLIKQFREATPLFKADFNGTATVSFSSDIYPGALSETIQGGNVGGWGLFGWGGPSETPLGVPWGGDPRRRPIRVTVPRNHQRCSILNVSFAHAYAYSPWQLQGISLVGNNISERTDN